GTLGSLARRCTSRPRRALSLGNLVRGTASWPSTPPPAREHEGNAGEEPERKTGDGQPLWTRHPLEAFLRLLRGQVEPASQSGHGTAEFFPVLGDLRLDFPRRAGLISGSIRVLLMCAHWCRAHQRKYPGSAYVRSLVPRSFTSVTSCFKLSRVRRGAK